MTKPETSDLNQRLSDISGKLADEFPDRCAKPFPCSTVERVISRIALDEATGEISHTEALLQAGGEAQRIGNDCRYGQEKLLGGRFGRSKCNIGLLCRFPG